VRHGVLTDCVRIAHSNRERPSRRCNGGPGGGQRGSHGVPAARCRWGLFGRALSARWRRDLGVIKRPALRGALSAVRETVRMRKPRKNPNRSDVPSWRTLWSRVRGRQRRLQLRGALEACVEGRETAATTAQDRSALCRACAQGRYATRHSVRALRRKGRERRRSQRRLEARRSTLHEVWTRSGRTRPGVGRSHVGGDSIVLQTLPRRRHSGATAPTRRMANQPARRPYNAPETSRRTSCCPRTPSLRSSGGEGRESSGAVDEPIRRASSRRDVTHQWQAGEPASSRATAHRTKLRREARAEGLDFAAA